MADDVLHNLGKIYQANDGANNRHMLLLTEGRNKPPNLYMKSIYQDSQFTIENQKQPH